MSDPDPTTRLVVGSDHEGERLDSVLAYLLHEARNRTAARIARGEVRLNGRSPAKSERVAAGDRIEVAPEPAAPTGADGVAPPPVRYEDDHLLIVDKPADLVVHPGVGRTAGTMVQALAEAGYPLAPAGGPTRPGIVHRLDKGTSGLLLVAKTDAAYDGLVDALRRRAVDRRYVTLVEGVTGAPKGRVEAPIGRDPRDRKRFAAVADGKPATTHWEVLGQGVAPESGTPATLLSCTLETGRTHQIRVHLSYAGHSVAGDVVYGASPSIAAELGLQRPFLHAARLAFDHPVTGARVDVEQPLPDDLRAASHRANLEPG